MRKRRKGILGFTFVETLLSVLIIGVIAGVVAQVLVSGLDVYALIVNRNNAFQTARLTMDRMVEEILYIDSTDIEWMGSTRFGFRDIDGYSTDFEKQTVSMGGDSVPCIYRGDDFLGGNVTYLDFDYYEEDGSSTIWSWLVRRINVDFIVEAPANAGSIRLRTDIFPRGFMYDNFE